MATTDDYSDLPDWIRPGAKLAIDTTGTLITVTRITATQIITVGDRYRNATYRFNRKPNPANPPYRPEPRYMQRGEYSRYLVRRNHPDVIAQLVNEIAGAAVEAVDAARKVYRNPRTSGDDRPLPERAMDLLDAIENAARKARREIEHLTDPGGMLAAEYATEHAQDLTTTPEG